MVDTKGKEIPCEFHLTSGETLLLFVPEHFHILQRQTGFIHVEDVCLNIAHIIFYKKREIPTLVQSIDEGETNAVSTPYIGKQ